MKHRTGAYSLAVGVSVLLAVGVAYGLPGGERGEAPWAAARSGASAPGLDGAGGEDGFPGLPDGAAADRVDDSAWPKGESVRQALLDSVDMASGEHTVVTYASHDWVEDLTTGEWYTLTDVTGAWSWGELAYDLTVIVDPDGYVRGNPEGMPGWLSMRIIDDIFYMHRPDLADELDGQTWIRMDASDDPEGQATLERLKSDDGLNSSPLEFTWLIELCSSFEWIGKEYRGATAVQGFQATASSTDLVLDGADLGDLGDLGISADVVDELAAVDVPDTFVMRMFVDETGYPVEVLYWITLGETQLGSENYFFDYRTELGFGHPPAEEIVTAAQLTEVFPDGAPPSRSFFEGYDHYDDYFLDVYGETAVERYQGYAGGSSRV